MPPNPSSPGGGSGRRRRKRSSSTSRSLAHAFNPITHPHHHPAPRQPAPSRHTTTAPVTDVQSSGGNYGLKKAEHFKHTRPYKRTVKSVYRHQPAKQRKMLAKAARKAKRPSVDQRVIKRTHRHWVQAERRRQALYKSAGLPFTPHRQRVLLGSTAPVKRIDTGGGGFPLGAILAAPAEAAAAPLIAGAKIIGSGIKHGPGAALSAATDLGTYDPFIHAAEKLPGTAGKIAKNAGKEYFDIPAEAVPSAYKLGKDLVTKGPGTAFSELLQPYKELAAHPGQFFVDNPLTTALMVAGPVRGVNRALGKAADVVGARAPEAARTAASYPHAHMEDIRHRTPGLAGRAAQEAEHKRRVRKYQRRISKANRLEKEGQQGKADDLRRKAADEHPARMSESDVARRVNEIEAINNIAQRAHGGRVGKAADETIKTGRKVRGRRHKGAALFLVARGIVKPTEADLIRYRDEIKAVEKSGKLSESEARDNRALVEQINESLKHNDLGHVPESVKKLRPLVKAIEGDLHDAGILPKERGERAALIPYAVKHMGLRHKEGEGFFDAKGRRVSNDQIRAHMKRHGFDPDPVFITQAPNMRGAKNFYMHYSKLRGIVSKRLTGKSTLNGTFDAHPETVVEQLRRSQSLLDVHHGFQRFVHDVGYRVKRGDESAVRRFSSKAEAQKRAENLNARGTEGKWTVVNADPWNTATAQVEHIINGTHVDEAAAKSVEKILSTALEGEGESGHFILVPETAQRQMLQFVRVLGAGGGGKAFRAISQTFRRTVLATSPKWLAGNFGEAALRSAVLHHFNPVDMVASYAAGKRILELSPEDAGFAGVPGGHYGFAGRSVRTALDDFITPESRPWTKRVFRVAGAIRQAKGPKQVVDAWQHYTKFVFDQVNGRLESPWQVMMTGHYSRKHIIPGGVLKVSRKAAQQAADGLTNTNEQVALARYVRDGYGNYTTYSPDMRRAIALYTPFVAWTINAVKFISVVLPRDHPVLTALIADMHQATAEWRKDHELDLWMKTRVPDFLQGSIPTGGGGHLRIPYTPFAAYGDLTGTFANALLPQLQSSVQGFTGHDWKGDPLYVKGGGEPTQFDKAKAGIKAFMEATIPIVGVAGRVADKGPSALNPLAPTGGLKKSSGKKRKGKGKGGLLIPNVPIPNVPIPGP